MNPELDTQHGIKGLVLSLIGLVAIYVLKDIGKGIYNYRTRNRRPTRDEFIELTRALKANSELLQQTKHVTEKMAMDITRIYLFLKVIAGAKWPEYRRQVKEMEDDYGR